MRINKLRRSVLLSMAVQEIIFFCFGITNRFLDPIILGDYPTEMREILGSKLPTFTREDRIKLRHKIDFIGINHYTTHYVQDCIFSHCELDKYNGNALVFASGEINGQLIGPPVRYNEIKISTKCNLKECLHCYTNLCNNTFEHIVIS